MCKNVVIERMKRGRGMGHISLVYSLDYRKLANDSPGKRHDHFLVCFHLRKKQTNLNLGFIKSWTHLLPYWSGRHQRIIINKPHRWRCGWLGDLSVKPSWPTLGVICLRFFEYQSLLALVRVDAHGRRSSARIFVALHKRHVLKRIRFFFVSFFFLRTHSI